MRSELLGGNPSLSNEMPGAMLHISRVNSTVIRVLHVPQ